MPSYVRTPWLAVAIMVASLVPATACRSSPDAPNAKVSPAGCEDACDGLRRAGCREGFDTAGGASCTAVCRDATPSRAWPLTCWSAAQSRADVLACPGPKTRCQPRE